MKSFEKSGELNTILGKGTKFEGKISVQHSLRVDGRFEGDIDTTDTLVIGKEGEVIGNTKVKDLVIGGKLNGTVVAQGKIVLESKSEFRGEMKTNKLVIDEGAIFEGKCSMSGDGKAPDFGKINKPGRINENDTH
ncbi:MAG: polymer-forming cytoskeletal protein [Actinobacteria bacterium]|nr:polymer-forming cytoskeletal protein [Actinomycetota bacterium]